MKQLGFNTLVQLLERVEGVRVMKPPDAAFMMVYGPKKKKGRRKEEGGGRSIGEGMCSSDGCVSSETEGVRRDTILILVSRSFYEELANVAHVAMFTYKS